MSLSGSIEPGTVAQLFQTLSKSNRQVTLLLHSGTQFGYAQFEAGLLLAVSLDDLEGDEALETLCAWQEGIYTIIKSEEQDQPSHAHAMLVGHLAPIHKGLNPWLTQHGFQTSQIPYHQAAVEIASFSHPDVVIVTCQEGERTCHDLKSELIAAIDPPPIVLLIGDENGSCTVEGAPCGNASYSIAQVKHVLATRWPRLLQGEEPMARRTNQPTGVVRPLQQDESTSAADAPVSDDVEASREASDSQVAAVAALAPPTGTQRKTALYAVAILLLAAGALTLFFVFPSESPTNVPISSDSPGAPTISNPAAAQTELDRQARTTDSPPPVAENQPATAQAAAATPPPEEADPPASPADSALTTSENEEESPGARTRPPARSQKQRAAGHKRPHPSRPAEVRRGTLVVQSNEPAMVSVDGVARGRTPVELTLDAGPHRVTVSSVARPQTQQARTVQIAAGSPVQLRIVFPEQGSPPSRSDPPASKAKKDDNDGLPTDNIDPWAR